MGQIEISGATTLGQSGPGNEGVLHIPQSSIITGASLLDYLVLYPAHSLQRCSQCILHPHLTGFFV